MSDTPPPASRRFNDRSPLALDVVLQSGMQSPVFGTLLDLSAGGACVEASKPSAEGEVLLIHLPWPSRDHPTALTAVVRWAESRRMGLQFTMAGPAEVEAVARLVSTHGLPGERSRRSVESAPNQAFSRDELLAVSTVTAEGPGAEVS